MNDELFDDTEIHKKVNEFSKEIDKIIEETVEEILSKKEMSS